MQPRQDKEENELPSKWKKSEIFVQASTDDAISLRGSNNVCKVRKINNSHIYFFKKYSESESLSNIGQAYELEAISGDFYRFILGTDRAAKSRVIVENGNNNITHAGVSSAENHAGYHDLREFWGAHLNHYLWEGRGNNTFANQIKDLQKDEFDKLTMEERDSFFQNGIYLFVRMNDSEEEADRYFEVIRFNRREMDKEKIDILKKNYLNYDNGMAELEMAMRILDEHDAGLHNCGLNNNKEVSRIDYDYTLYKVAPPSKKRDSRFNNISSRDIVDFYGQSELHVPAENHVARQRFYTCQLNTLILSSHEVITALCTRHTNSKQMIQDIASLIDANVEQLRKALFASSDFVSFMKNVNFNDIKCHFESMFKSEKKHSIDTYEIILAAINDKFDLIQSDLATPRAMLG